MRRAFAGLWSRLSMVWKVVTVLATLGIAVAFVLLLVALFRPEPERKLRVGDTAVFRPFDYSFRKIACHKRRKDLPKPIEERPFRIKGELCFAYFQIRNSSDESQRFFIGSSTVARLHVRDEEYDATAATPMLPGTMFPDQEESLTFIFDIPHRVEPTALTLKDGQGEEEGDEVEWEIREVDEAADAARRTGHGGILLTGAFLGDRPDGIPRLNGRRPCGDARLMDRPPAALGPGTATR